MNFRESVRETFRVWASIGVGKIFGWSLVLGTILGGVVGIVVTVAFLVYSIASYNSPSLFLSFGFLNTIISIPIGLVWMFFWVDIFTRWDFIDKLMEKTLK